MPFKRPPPEKLTNAQLIEMLKKQPADACICLTDSDGYNSDINFYVGSELLFIQDRTSDDGKFDGLMQINKE